MMAGSTRGPVGCMRCSMCRLWFRALKWLPVILIITIIMWSYYAYVVQLCFMTAESTLERISYLVPYHILLIMFLWAYARTIFATIQPIPTKYKLPSSEMEKLLAADSEDAQRLILEHFTKDLPIVTRTMSGAIRYCNRCVLVKPDRAHHCSMCGVCVMKMDHHCPWVNNCVCFHNYKFFILFLGYALGYCAFVMATVMPYFIQFWRKAYPPGSGLPVSNPGQFHVVFVFFVAVMFGISLASLFGYHVYLVLQNRTTLESFRAPMFRSGPDKNGFSLGAFNNFKEVFGKDPHYWFIPVFTSLGDGCEFPVRAEHRLQPAGAGETRGYDAMGTTRARSASTSELDSEAQ